MSAAPVRFASVDALRGLTVAAMLLVNTPGDWSHVYPPLLHAAWHGVTPTDLVFPFFLFIVGVSISLGVVPRAEAGGPRAALVRALLWRAVKIVALGLALHLLAYLLLGKRRGFVLSAPFMLAALLLYFEDNHLQLDAAGLIDLGNATLCGVLILVFVHIYDEASRAGARCLSAKIASSLGQSPIGIENNVRKITSAAAKLASSSISTSPSGMVSIKSSACNVVTWPYCSSAMQNSRSLSLAATALDRKRSTTSRQ